MIVYKILLLRVKFNRILDSLISGFISSELKTIFNLRQKLLPMEVKLLRTRTFLRI